MLLNSHYIIISIATKTTLQPSVCTYERHQIPAFAHLSLDNLGASDAGGQHELNEL